MGFGSDVIEERVSPCGDTLFGCGGGIGSKWNLYR